MEKLGENLTRCQELAISRQRFNQSGKIDDPFVVKGGALSYVINSLKTLARPRRTSFEDDSINCSIPRAPKVLSTEDSERDSKLFATRARLVKMLMSRGRNQLDLDIYALMVKRGPVSYGISGSIGPKLPRRSLLQEESSKDYSYIRASNFSSQIVIDSDKQLLSRIKKLGKPRTRYLDCNDIWMNCNDDNQRNDFWMDY